jgi:excisionase family DNA binding protein
VPLLRGEVDVNLLERLRLMPRGTLVPAEWVLEELERDAPPSPAAGDLTVEQVGERLGRRPGTVRDWIRAGKLRAYKLRGREYRITEQALGEFLDAERQGSTSPQRAAPGAAADLSSWRTIRRQKAS